VIQGNNFFAHVLSRELEVRVNARVESVTPKADGLECEGQIYRAVVSALPAPQTARLFALDQTATEYTSCLSMILEYAGTFAGESEQCYGRIGGGEPVASSYCENHKAGRILGDKSVFVVQAAPEFSEANAERPAEDFIPKLAGVHEEMWKISAGKRTAAFARRWQLSRSRPDRRRELDLPGGAFVCGDSRSESTVEDVWLDGRRAAEEVLAYLEG
jgi:predicted NAD/FAD-dependent oxidoreductase